MDVAAIYGAGFSLGLLVCYGMFIYAGVGYEIRRGIESRD